MLNRKGQALVEFVMILPVFLLLVLGTIDFGKIIYEKYTLQNKLDLIVDLYKEQKFDSMNEYVNQNGLQLNIDKNENFITIKISKNIDITTPGINVVLNDPYKVEESIVIFNETE